MMALSLVMMSCGGGEEEEEEEVVEEEEEEEEVVVEEEEPQYGDQVTIAMSADWSRWDPATTQAIMVGHMQWTSNEMIQGDWTKGPVALGGTGETAWEIGFLGLYDLLTGELAESWSMPDNTHIRFTIRDDIYFQDIPPANGRQMTIEDVAWNIEMQFTWDQTWQQIAYGLTGRDPSAYTIIDDHTVEVTVLPEVQEILLLEIGDNLYVNPPEVWVEDGPGTGEGMADWTKVVGSGPWIIEDYVADSRILLEANPTYWETDPFHPENNLPYLDNVEILVIADASSRLASFRTGQVDFMQNLTWDDAGTLMEDYPDIRWVEYTGAPMLAAGRNDQAPFDKLKVRQAMNMAVDKMDILENYYEGKGAYFAYPFPPTPGYAAYYTELEDMPEEVQMLWDYDVERALELMDEAGEGEGFTTTVTCTSADVDFLSIIKDNLEDINITMEINSLELGNYYSVRGQKSWDGMFYGMAGFWAPFELLNTKDGQTLNFGMINDPYFENDVQLCVGSNIVSSPETYIQCMKDAAEYELALAWAIFTPTRSSYHMWWPWLRNYEGINWTGWANIQDWYKYLWIDQDLKASMGY